MLVLSRRLNEKIVFPSIQAAVEIVSVRAGVVRLGIQAPAEVVVMREELLERSAVSSGGGSGGSQAGQAGVSAADAALRRLLCKRLQIAGVGFALLKEQLGAGRTQEAEETVAKLNEDLELLARRLEGEAKSPPAAAPPAPPRKSRALLVEDNANERELLATFLRMSGVDVDTAADGADALDYLRCHDRPDVLLLDMGLPHCDGATMIREVRRRPAFAGLKIFAVTGRAKEEFDLGHADGGVDRWFRKPVDPLALVRDVNEELTQSLNCR